MGKKRKTIFFAALEAVILLVCFASCSRSSEPDAASKTNLTVSGSYSSVYSRVTSESEESTSQPPVQSEGSSATQAVSEISSASVETTQTPAASELTPDVTIGERNALKSAKNYLSFMAFSYTRLIGQLEFEGYTNAEATYAADHCGADWNEQALKAAKNYLDFQAFSYSGLIEQLEFEGFSGGQAAYAADHCGADWNEQAAKSAARYLEYMAFSRESLIAQLEFEGFTHEQAVYGAQANGY